MSSEHLFIADVHLGAFKPKRNQQIEADLIEIVNYAILNKARLYFLGDLFDYWMEFPRSNYLPPIGENLLEALRIYMQKVDSVLFITGNHDNWTLGYFSSLGFDVEQDFRIIELSNTQTFLMHGDGLMNGKGTLTRPLVHQLLRNKNFLTLYRAIFRNGLGLGLMRLFSNLTRSFERVNPVRLSTNAHWILEHLPVQTVICGHDHIPRTEKTDSGLYINTGAFFQHKTVARYVDGAYTLVQWNADTQTFTPFSQLVHEY